MYIDVAGSHVSFSGCLDSSENRHGDSASSLFFAETLVIDRVLSEGSVRSCPSTRGNL